MVTYVLHIPVHIKEIQITDNGWQQQIFVVTTWTKDNPDPHSSFGKIVYEYFGWVSTPSRCHFKFVLSS